MKWHHLFFIFIILCSLQRCATVIAPKGGPKDTIPPQPESSIPPDNSKNFKGKIVSVTFDELIKLKDQKEIIITPRPGKNITILAKNRTLTIEPKEQWHDSTTYSINFREGVQDITESTSAKNLHLAFSTGPVIDSLKITGNVHLLLKETPPEKATVAIFQQDTFNIFKHTPSYFTETAKDGSFQINNLKPGKYFIYAFDDKNKNLKVDSQTELYGFIGDTLYVKSDLENLDIYLANVDSRKLLVKTTRHNNKMTKVRFNKGTTTYSLTPTDTVTPIHSYGDNQAEINIYHWEGLLDSVSFQLSAIDSLGAKLDTIIYVKQSAAKTVKDRFSVSVNTIQYNYDKAAIQVGLKYTVPLKKIQNDTILIKVDTTYTIHIYPDNIIIDSIYKTLSFECPFSKKNVETMTSPLQLTISKGVFISVEDDSSKFLKAQIPFLKGEETGTMEVKAETDESNFIIQIITSEYKVEQQAINTKDIVFKDLPPTTYKIRVIVDTNKNGKWDLGNIYEQREPEKIFYLKNTINDKYDFPLRANWESGPYTIRF